jgi:dipeptidyl aminopeptidase/acylaminoacyl peptidase
MKQAVASSGRPVVAAAASVRRLSLLVLVLGLLPSVLLAQEKRTLTFAELMQFRQIANPSISKDGRWIALAAEPDRGDGEVIVRSTDGATRHVVPLGARPVISGDASWVAMRLNPSLEASETAKGKDKPRPGLALLETASGEVATWDEVQRFAFSEDGGWLARLHHEPKGDEDDDSDVEDDRNDEGEEQDDERTREKPGTTLVVRDLSSGDETEVEYVRSFAFDEQGRYLAYVVAAPDGEGDGLYVMELQRDGLPVQALDARSFAHIGSWSWWKEGSRFAWVSADEDKKGKPGPGSLLMWTGDEVTSAVAAEDVPEGWMLPAENSLRWTEDGERLFFGYRPAPDNEEGAGESGTEESDGAESEEAFDPFDFDAILEKREVDVWHTDDPLIVPNQKQIWEDEQKRTFAAVYHLNDGRAVQLGDTVVQLDDLPENSKTALGSSPVPYFRERTWVGFQSDVYVVDLEDGARTKVAERHRGGGSTVASWLGRAVSSGPSLALSPEGRYVVYFQDDQWHMFDVERDSSRTLTEGMDGPFYDVDHDYPQPRPGYGIGGWIAGDRAVLIHDKYDVWQFPTDGSDPVNLTGGRGRAENRVFRVLRVDRDLEAFEPDARIHLASFGELDKGFGFHRTRAGRGGLERLVEEGRRFRFLAKAEDADVLLYTREDYDEFPDLWVADLWFDDARKLTYVNPQMNEFAWGTSELVEWASDDGIMLQGVVIKPGNYEPGNRYPVLTYFYRFFSQRLHEFNQPVVNHRPSFPIYASDGYIVFLPDVRFEVGRPGISSMKSVVPGVKKLVDMGLADPDALGLHGHSWSGYTTSYIVTQTDIFAAAVAGAPVSNMTSAYGGIRWGSGLARQFQYEQSQSRLSGSLWEARRDYIENSPLFFADYIETPLVIMHGDEDEAVPWYQSIEFYLALRRLGKPAVFLQYRGEPHHPQKYANKLDYSIKMKEFFDHFLKGSPAPAWWIEGVPYKGK